MSLNGVVMALILVMSPKSVAFEAHCIKVVEDVVVIKFTFAISSPDEFLVRFSHTIGSFTSHLSQFFSKPRTSVTERRDKERKIKYAAINWMLYVLADHSVRGPHRCYPRSRCLRHKATFQERTDDLLDEHISTCLVRMPLDRQNDYFLKLVTQNAIPP